MYEFIRGTLIESTPFHAIVDVGGVGYKLLIPVSAFGKTTSNPVLFYTSFVVREQFQGLYGFLEVEERNLFELLITLSGIGPKTALNLIGHLPLKDFQRAILTENTKSITQVPGIGKKTAERLIIELKEKILKFKSAEIDLPTQYHLDGVNALVHLGYNQGAAEKAIKKAMEELPQNQRDLSTIIATALKKAL